ncbi:MAG: bacterio-opsin activator domain-containing protein [Halobaculum sp.]
MTIGASQSDEQVVEVQFTISDRTYPVVRLTDQEDCRLELERLLPRGSDRFAEYFHVDGAGPDRVFEVCENDDLIDPRLVSSTAEGGLFEFVTSDACPVADLTTHRAVPTAVHGEDGTVTIHAEFPSEEADESLDSYLDHHDVTLFGKTTTEKSESPLSHSGPVHRHLLDSLTDRQREVLLAAYDAGYYERPRETTGEEIGEMLGISPPTFHQHIRAAERKVIEAVTGDRES